MFLLERSQEVFENKKSVPVKYSKRTRNQPPQKPQTLPNGLPQCRGRMAAKSTCVASASRRAIS